MKITIRDLLALATVVALIAALAIQSRQHGAEVARLDQQIRSANNLLIFANNSVTNLMTQIDQGTVEAKRVQSELRNEIASLKGVIKDSLEDKRLWLDVQTRNNRIVAISSATTEPIELTDRTVSRVESKTGFDGRQYRRMIQPIEMLKIKPLSEAAQGTTE